MTVTLIGYHNPMADMFRRAHSRLACDRPALIFTGATGGRKLGEARLLDASVEGAYLRFRGELQHGVPFRLVIDAPDGALELPFRVAREGPRGGVADPAARHYGVNFNLTSDQERRLRALLETLRRPAP